MSDGKWRHINIAASWQIVNWTIFVSSESGLLSCLAGKVKKKQKQKQNKSLIYDLHNNQCISLYIFFWLCQILLPSKLTLITWQLPARKGGWGKPGRKCEGKLCIFSNCCSSYITVKCNKWYPSSSAYMSLQTNTTGLCCCDWQLKEGTIPPTHIKHVLWLPAINCYSIF